MCLDTCSKKCEDDDKLFETIQTNKKGENMFYWWCWRTCYVLLVVLENLLCSTGTGWTCNVCSPT